MKRLSRNNEKFDTLELSSAMARQHGYRLDDTQSTNDFIRQVRKSLEDSQGNPITIYGKRIEGLFAYVAGALGKAAIIKQEDAGEVFYASEEILPPDYRVTLKNGQQFLVEVKNYHNKNLSGKLSIKENYLSKLLRYAELNNLPIKFAIYFSLLNQWALVAIDSFEETGGRYEIDLPSAIGKSEMAILGDRMIGTTPNLEIVFETDEEHAELVDDEGKANFTIQNIRMFCATNEITEDLEKRLCFYFTRFGAVPHLKVGTTSVKL